VQRVLQVQGNQGHHGTGGGRVQEASGGTVAQSAAAEQRARQQRRRGPPVDDREGRRQQCAGGQGEAAGQAPAGLGDDRGADYERHDRCGEGRRSRQVQRHLGLVAGVPVEGQHDDRAQDSGEREVAPEYGAPAGQVGDDAADDEAAGPGGRARRAPGGDRPPPGRPRRGDGRQQPQSGRHRGRSGGALQAPPRGQDDHRGGCGGNGRTRREDGQAGTTTVTPSTSMNCTRHSAVTASGTRRGAEVVAIRPRISAAGPSLEPRSGERSA
jgi:hypothetical protein